MTGTMFAEMKMGSIEVDLTVKSDVSVKFKDGQWVII